MQTNPTSRPLRLSLLAIVAVLAAAPPSSRAADPTAHTATNVMVELSFTAARPHADPFNDVTLDVAFTDPAHHTFRVPAFWAGGDRWTVRYASPVPGTHTFRTECSDPADPGLHHLTGSVTITPYAGPNPLYAHGPLRVSPSHRYLQHADGTPFFWLGDTWWMGLCHRLHWPDEVKTLAADRKAKGFTVIQLVAGLYPDMLTFDPRGANEAGFPWEKGYARIRPEYFDAADQRLMYLVDQGLTPCIVGAWGYFMPWMGVDKVNAHWRYLIARYGALPVVWCAAGEANLPWYQAKGFPYDDRDQVKKWTDVMRYIRATDPFHRPLTIHPTGIGRLSARHATDDPALLDIDFLQTPHGQRDAVPPTVSTVRDSYADHPVMPVIDGEASYEMLNGVIKAEWPRRMFWLCMTNGAAGHTYGANGIWQCNRKGQPHGPSPTAGSPPTGYGATPWDEAMNFPGSRQVGLGKRFFEQFPWYDFEPHPEWAAYPAPADAPLSFDTCDWIWSPDCNAAQNAPAEKRFFRRIFDLPPNSAAKAAYLRLTADDRFSATVNGHPVGSSAQANESWRTPRQFDITPHLKPGPNVLAVEAENLPAPAANPAGLVARLEIRLDNGQSFTLTSDADWRVSTSAPANWDTPDFDDHTWPRAAVTAHFGQGPWGRPDAAPPDPVFGPQATGIPGTVRIIYVPDPEPVELRALAKGATYTASWFDPVTGDSHPLPPVRAANDAGTAAVPPPATIGHDWVLVLRDAARAQP